MTDTPKPDVAEMTRFLAVEVMGWALKYVTPSGNYWYIDDSGDMHGIGENLNHVDAWSPDTVPADRDMLVEAMRKKGFLVDVLTRLNGERQALVYMDEKEGDVFSDVADTPGTAVCLAAAKALLATMKEKP